MPKYFDEPVVKQHCINYQQAETQEERNYIYENHLAKPIDLLIRGVINTHRLYRFDGWDDAYSVGLETCLKNLDVFDATKGFKLFSYLSISVKRSIIFTTLRNKKNREEQNLDDHGYLTTEQSNDVLNQSVMDSFLEYAAYYAPLYFSYKSKNILKRYLDMIDCISNIEPTDLQKMTKRKLLAYMRECLNIKQNQTASAYRHIKDYFDTILPYYNSDKPPEIQTKRERVYFLPSEYLIFSYPQMVENYCLKREKFRRVDTLGIEVREETVLNGYRIIRLK